MPIIPISPQDEKIITIWRNALSEIFGATAPIKQVGNIEKHSSRIAYSGIAYIMKNIIFASNSILPRRKYSITEKDIIVYINTTTQYSLVNSRTFCLIPIICAIIVYRMKMFCSHKIWGSDLFSNSGNISTISRPIEEYTNNTRMLRLYLM